MIDVASIIGSTRPGRKGEAAAGNHSEPCRPIPRTEPGRALPAVQPPARWHATRAGGGADEDGEITMDALVVPPLSRDTAWIEVIASGRSAQARAILPVRWQAYRPAT
jgi:hypothetical protein